MAQKNRAQMLTDITTNIFNNVINFITGQNAQDRLVNLLDSSPNIISDKDQADGYVGLDAIGNMFSSYYNENISRADLVNLLTTNTAIGYKLYQVNDAVGATKILLVIADSNVTLYPFAIDLTTAEIGTYDINTDTFTVLAGSGNASIISTTVTGLQGLQTTSSLSTTTLYNVTNAVGNTLVLQVYAIANNTNVVYAIDVASGTIGTYNITTDTFTATTSTPDLQQVTDVGFTTTNRLVSDDVAGNSVEVGNGYVKIATGNLGDVNINASLVTASYTAQLPDKPTSPQTFAMLSDITGGGLDLEVNGTPNGDQTLLNLIEGVNIDIADNGTGGVTITSLADRYKTTSTSTNTINNNNGKIFIVDANLSYIPLQEVLIVNDPTHHMHGTVVSYNSTTGSLEVDINSHTGTGTFSSWVINLDGTPVDAITGSGTANEIAYFTGGQAIASLAVVTYPSLTELSYVKGVTTAIQTQLNNAGTLSIECIAGTITSPVDLATYFWCIGGTFLTASTSVTGQGSKFAYTFEITGITIRMTTTTAGSAEDSTLYLRNITTSTSTLMGTFKTNGNIAYTSITGLAISCNTTDEYCLEMRSPTWATNPANLRLTASLFLRRT